MRQEELTGRVQTVLGIIDADDLGVTLPHEHLLHDGSSSLVEPTDATEKRLVHQPITLENLYWVKVHQFSIKHLDNLKMMDEKLLIKEVLLYKRAGGDTIVALDNNRDPLGLVRIAQATGLNIVTSSVCTPDLATKTEEELTEAIVRDIMVGVDNTGVRAGIIGEVWCSTPLTDNERKDLRASAAAQRRTGAALNIHPSHEEDLVMEIIKILGNAGADLSHTVIDHMDYFCFSQATCRRIADTGCYIEFDIFGHFIPVPSPFLREGRLVGRRSEVDRINQIKDLIDEGYLSHILISNDVSCKHRLVTYGGAGYAHILRNVVPWMRRGGISDEQIHTMMVENPKRYLPFAPVKE